MLFLFHTKVNVVRKKFEIKTERAKTIDSELKSVEKFDKILDKLALTNDLGLPPILKEERTYLRLQLLCAEVLARDVMELANEDDSAKPKEILDDLAQNVIETIKAMAVEILKRKSLQVDPTNELKRLEKGWQYVLNR